MSFVDLNYFEKINRSACLKVLRSQGCTRFEAAEIIAEALLKMQETIIKGELKHGNIGGFFYKICINEFYSRKRKQQKETIVLADFSQREAEGYFMQIDHEDYDETLDKDAERKLDIIKRLYQQLSEKERLLLWLTVMADSKTSQKTIAERLDYKNANTVKTTKAKCLKKLRERYNELEMNLTNE